MDMSVNHLLEGVSGLLHRHRFTRPKPVNANVAAQKQLGIQDRVAIGITGALGTMYAVYFFAFFMAGWIAWQMIMDKGAFDPYPYAFLLFIGNIVQLLLMPLIMVSQNVQGKHAELRAEEQYKATVASYVDNEYMMDHLVALDMEMLRHRQLLMQIATQLGCPIPEDMDVGISVPSTHTQPGTETSEPSDAEQKQADTECLDVIHMPIQTDKDEPPSAGG